MSKSLSIKKNDKVRIIAGKDKGKEGRILRANPESQRVVVEGANFIKKAQRPTQKSPQGGILQMEGTIHVSNVMLLCPSCGQATRVGRKREDGVRLRVCKKCGQTVDK
jgi:large subunit ribosomal protein L24